MKTDNPGSTRTNPVIAGVVVSVMILSVVGVAAITGVLPSETPTKQNGMARAQSAMGAPTIDCALCGTVESIRIVEVRDEAGGALGGRLAGAAMGKDGSTTILGTVGRAASESEMATSMKKRYAYRVTVRMDDGSYRTVSLSSAPALAAGDKVRVVEGKLVRT